MAIVFFDYDGTLVDESHEVYHPTEKSMKAIKELQEAGHYAVLATGRAKSYVPDTGIKWDGIIASNGAYAEINGTVVYNHFVPEALVRELINRSAEIGYIYVLENQDFCYTNGYGNEHFMKTLDFFDISKKNFRPIEEAKKLTANKMFLTYEDDSVFDKLCEIFKGKFIFGKHRHNNSCDCDLCGNNKGVGVAEIAAAVNVDINDTYAFGDSVNDYDMLKNAAHGIAMGEHRSELDEVCEFVTDTVLDEGVYNALHKTILN